MGPRALSAFRMRAVLLLLCPPLEVAFDQAGVSLDDVHLGFHAVLTGSSPLLIKIVDVSPNKADEHANGHHALDLSGSTVLPGLLELHDHLFYVARANNNAEYQTGLPILLPQMSYPASPLYHVNGVTTARTAGCFNGGVKSSTRRHYYRRSADALLRVVGSGRRAGLRTAAAGHAARPAAITLYRSLRLAPD